MKMRKIRYVQLGLILAFTLIVGTCLPPFISRIQEQSLLDQEAVEETEVVSVSRTERMEKKEPMEKFLFLMQPDVEYIEYAAGTGSSRNADTARDQMGMEIEQLWGQGMLAGTSMVTGDFYGGFQVLTEGVYTAANTKNPAQSLLVWRYTVIGSYGELYEVTMDDASGKIIGLQMLAAQADALPDLMASGYEGFAYAWGNYLGMSHMEVQDISYEKVDRDLILKQWKENDRNFSDLMEEYGLAELYDATEPHEENTEIKENKESKEVKEPKEANWSSDVPWDIVGEGIVLDVKYYYGQSGEGAVRLTWNACTCGFAAVE